MEAVGSEVFAVIMPVVTILGVLVYLFRKQIIRLYRRVYVAIFGQQRVGQQFVDRHPAYGADQCSICLQQPKIFQASGTCGHSFCSECIFTIYQRTDQKVACPLCRKPITTIFRVFDDSQNPAQTRVEMLGKIREYNDRFDDNRPLIRRIQQFPYVIKRVLRYMTNPRFWILFIKSVYFFKVIIAAIVYLIMPVDLIPEKLFGFIGLLDDLIIFGVFILIGVALFAPIFIRGHA